MGKSKKWIILIRILISVAIPIAFTFLYYSFVIKTTHISIDGAALTEAGVNQNACLQVGEKIKQLYKALDTIKSKEEGLNSLVKLPGNLFGYNLYAENNLMAKTEDNKNINIVFNIDINENYREINFSKNKKILTISSLNNFSIDKMDHSFRFYFEDTKKEAPTSTMISYIDGRRNINLYLSPTFSSFLIVLLAGLIFSYGVLLLMAGYYKFIIFGNPFVER